MYFDRLAFIDNAMLQRIHATQLRCLLYQSSTYAFL